MSDTPPDHVLALREFLLGIAAVNLLIGDRVFAPELPGAEAILMPRKCVVLRPAGGGAEHHPG